MRSSPHGRPAVPTHHASPRFVARRGPRSFEAAAVLAPFPVRPRRPTDARHEARDASDVPPSLGKPPLRSVSRIPRATAASGCRCVATTAGCRRIGSRRAGAGRSPSVMESVMSGRTAAGRRRRRESPGRRLPRPLRTQRAHAGSHFTITGGRAGAAVPASPGIPTGRNASGADAVIRSGAARRRLARTSSAMHRASAARPRDSGEILHGPRRVGPPEGLDDERAALLPLRPPPVGRFGGGAPRVSWRYGLEPRTFGQPRPCVHRVRVRHAVADRCRVERHGGRQAAVGRWRASAGPRTPRRPVRVRRRRARADGPRGGGPGSEVERRRRLSSHSSSLCCS